MVTLPFGVELVAFLVAIAVCMVCVYMLAHVTVSSAGPFTKTLAIVTMFLLSSVVAVIAAVFL